MPILRILGAALAALFVTASASPAQYPTAEYTLHYRFALAAHQAGHSGGLLARARGAGSATLPAASGGEASIVAPDFKLTLDRAGSAKDEHYTLTARGGKLTTAAGKRELLIVAKVVRSDTRGCPADGNSRLAIALTDATGRTHDRIEISNRIGCDLAPLTFRSSDPKKVSISVPAPAKG